MLLELYAIMLPQMIGYVRCFDSNRTISFKISDKKQLKKYIKIWEKISSLVGKEFDSKPVYGDSDKYIKTKIKSCRDNVNTNFQGKKYQKKIHHRNHLQITSYNPLFSFRLELFIMFIVSFLLIYQK